MIDINELNRKLKQAQKDVQEYQRNCKHQKSAMGMRYNNTIKWHCIKCDVFIRIPTQKEVTEWLDK